MLVCKIRSMHEEEYERIWIGPEVIWLKTIRSSNWIDVSTFIGGHTISPPFGCSSVEMAGYENKNGTSRNISYRTCLKVSRKLPNSSCGWVGDLCNEIT